MKKLIALFLFVFLLCSSSYSQCSIDVTSADFEYNVTIDLDVTDVIYTQNGTTCNVQIEVEYDIEIDVINQPGWWNESLYTLQGNFNCVGGSGSSFFDLPNSGGTGTVTSATFSYNNELCTEVSLDCPITITIEGPDLNFTGDCGTYAESSLPVILKDFSHENNEEHLTLFWSTASEVNFSHFEIETSHDHIKWEFTDYVETANNKSGSAYSKLIPFSKKDRYIRLKMMDLDGLFEYSESLFISSKSEIELNIHPNPTSNSLNISGPTVDQIEILDYLGQRLNLPILSDKSIDVSSLKTGYYTIRTYGSSRVKSKRFLKL